jgi:tetratricopeptide (TPR) repeat protein
MRWILFLLFLSSPALAETCPDAPDHSAKVDRLIGDVQKAQSESEARQISNDMWSYWTDAPDSIAQEMLDRGMRKRESFDYLGALQDLNALVDYCPDYAEGYNQRAFVNYLRQDFARALPDLDRAIALSPRHIGALSGRALTLIGLGREDEARDALLDALELNPWLPERGILPSLPPKPGIEL